MPLSFYDVYFHIPKPKIDSIIESLDKIPSNRQTETDVLYLQKLNEDADLLLPVMSDGKRVTDIDSLAQIANPVGRDLLLSRMVAIPSPDPDNTMLSDDQIAENVVPKDSTFSDVHSLVNDLNDYIDEGAELDKQSLTSTPVDDNPPTPSNPSE